MVGRKVSAVQQRTSTTKYTLYTVPSKHHALWEVLYVISLVSNDSPSVYWYDSSTSTEYQIFGGKNLGAGEYLLLSNAEVALEEGDEIRVQNSTTNAVTYVCTFEAIQNPATGRYNG
jgi:hypothetical protein